MENFTSLRRSNQFHFSIALPKRLQNTRGHLAKSMISYSCGTVVPPSHLELCRTVIFNKQKKKMTPRHNSLLLQFSSLSFIIFSLLNAHHQFLLEKINKIKGFLNTQKMNFLIGSFHNCTTCHSPAWFSHVVK